MEQSPPFLYAWTDYIGYQVTVVGILVLLFALFNRRHKDRVLVYFAAICILYGSRLLIELQLNRPDLEHGPVWWTYAYASLFITYTIPIPLTGFLYHVFGPGWKNLLLWIFRGTVILAALELIIDIVVAEPFASMPLNNIAVLLAGCVWLLSIFVAEVSQRRESKVLIAGFSIFILFALNENLISLGVLPWDFRNEAIGFLVFLIAMGYVAAIRYFNTEKELSAIQHEVDTARQIQNSILPAELPSLPGISITARYIPMTTVAGDFYDVIQLDDQRLVMLVADVSGHGLGSALIASMLKIAFVCQLDHTSDPAELMRGINQTFQGRIGQQFVTAICVVIDVGRNRLTYANAGHPSALLIRAESRDIAQLPSQGLILGPFAEAEYSSDTLPFQPGDRLVLYTDGITEAENAAGEMFEFDRLVKHGLDGSDLPADQFADSLLRDVRSWSNKIATDCPDDDLTLVVIDLHQSRS